MLTREVGSETLQTLAVTLTGSDPWAQIFAGDIDRRGVVVYVDPNAPGPAYLSDSQAHAQQKTNGAKMSPDGSPPGFELGTTGAAWVYALPTDLALGEITVYAVIEHGEIPRSAGN